MAHLITSYSSKQVTASSRELPGPRTDVLCSAGKHGLQLHG